MTKPTELTGLEISGGTVSNEGTLDVEGETSIEAIKNSGNLSISSAVPEDKMNIGKLVASGDSTMLFKNTSISMVEFIVRGIVVIDPAYFEAEIFDTSDGVTVVGSGSVAKVGGGYDNLKDIVSVAGFSPSDMGTSASGFTVAPDQVVFAMNSQLQLGTLGKLLVDPNLTADNYKTYPSFTSLDAGSARFATNSLLVVNVNALSESAITGGGTITIDTGSKLALVDVEYNKDYVLADFDNGVNADMPESVDDPRAGKAWNEDSLSIREMIEKDETYVWKNGGKILVHIGGMSDPRKKYPGILIADSIRELPNVGIDVNSDSPSIRFLSRLIDNTAGGYMEDVSKVAPAANEVAELGAISGIQNTAIRVSEASTDLLSSHMSLGWKDIRSKEISLRNMNLWFTPIYGNSTLSNMGVGNTSLHEN